MTEDLINFKLTHHQYPIRGEYSLTEIQYYLKIYNELSAPQFTNPITGNVVDLTELFKPMLRRRFVFIGIGLSIAAFIINIHVLKNLRFESAVLSYVAFMCACFGTAMLIPTLFIEFLNRMRRIRAKNKARHLAKSHIRQQLPSLEKITDELVAHLAHVESPIMSNLMSIFDNIAKELDASQIAMVFNHIFADDENDISPFLLDAEKFQNAKENFITLLKDGIDYGHETGMIEDPKFIQFLSYSFATAFLRHALKEPESPYFFPNLEFEDFIELYHNFCTKFSSYCKNEYGVEAFYQHVEDRLMVLIDSFIFHDEEETEEIKIDTAA